MWDSRRSIKEKEEKWSFKNKLSSSFSENNAWGVT
jgi:hypothetical protein